MHGPTYVCDGADQLTILGDYFDSQLSAA
jgi:hypothetical protein